MSWESGSFCHLSDEWPIILLLLQIRKTRAVVLGKNKAVIVKLKANLLQVVRLLNQHTIEKCLHENFAWDVKIL
jgi:hypothetical protein